MLSIHLPTEINSKNTGILSKRLQVFHNLTLLQKSSTSSRGNLYKRDASKAKLRDERNKRKKHPTGLNALASNSHWWRLNQWKREWNNGIVEFYKSLRSSSSPEKSEVLFLFFLCIASMTPVEQTTTILSGENNN